MLSSQGMHKQNYKQYVDMLNFTFYLYLQMAQTTQWSPAILNDMKEVKLIISMSHPKFPSTMDKVLKMLSGYNLIIVVDFHQC